MYFMKKIIFSLLTLGVIFIMQSCSEDFDVSAPYKPVSVVYGVLDMKDTAHYIRIQKSFLDESKNAFEMAKVSDSNFYKEGDIEVMIKELAGSVPVGQPSVLQRVDMEAEGFMKDSGVFFRRPNYAYKFKRVLNASSTYRLLIHNRLTNSVDSADISLVDSGRLNLRGTVLNRSLNFANTNPQLAGSNFGLYVDPGNAEYIEGAIRFRWVEKAANSTVGTPDSADFVFAVLSSRDAVREGELLVENFKIHAFLQVSMGPAPEGARRFMDSCDIIIYGAGREFSEYATTLQIQSSGLTADQIKPLYTNIRGKDVFGLFSSKTTRVVKNAYINDATLTVLNESPALRELAIQKERADP